MNSLIFDRCVKAADDILKALENHNGYPAKNKLDGNVSDYLFVNEHYRRAHVSIVDARDTKSFWLLHVTIFPHVDDGCPIYGFDIVAGPNKVSGAFHDFSSSGHNNHCMMKWFSDQTKDLAWNKRRELPEWAANIFSKDIVAIGAVGIEELDAFCNLGLKTLEYYLENVGCTKSYLHDHTESQNFYCEQQRLNPHTPRVLQTLGFTADQAKTFVEDTLFPLLPNKGKL